MSSARSSPSFGSAFPLQLHGRCGADRMLIVVFRDTFLSDSDGMRAQCPSNLASSISHFDRSAGPIFGWVDNVRIRAERSRVQVP